MSRFFKRLRNIFLGLFIIGIVLIAGLNIYYEVLLNDILEADYTEKEGFRREKPEDSLTDYQIVLIPYPQRVELIPGLFTMPEQISFTAEDDIKTPIKGWIEQCFMGEAVARQNSTIRFILQESIPDQGYRLQLNTNRIDIHYSTPAGAYYALITLKQLNSGYSGVIPNMIIEDEPDLLTRGVMLDISRNKVPKLQTLYGIVDMLADLKYNHLELYVEGFSFAYPSFESLWQGKETPITGEEIRSLDAYCRERLIDLVPNQNSLGHMAAWLDTEAYAGLAECPKGYRISPMIKFKTTLDPYDPGSIELVDRMMGDLLPNFSSPYFNANLDEPFELGQCKSRKEAERMGVGKVYLEFTQKVKALSEGYGKRMMMWADVALKHPEVITDIPKDIILLDWGYEAEYPFNETCAVFQQAGLPFMVCPGTSSWTSIGGRTNNMIGNVSHAVNNGIRHGAGGMLITDWGDMGHWQYLPVSYAGFVVGGGLSWNAGSYNEALLENYLDQFIYKDRNKKTGTFSLDLGRYNQFEELLAPNMTLINLGFQFGLVDPVLYQAVLQSLPATFEKLIPKHMAFMIEDRFIPTKPFDHDGLMDYLDALETDLQSSDMMIPEATLVEDEFLNAILLIRIGAGLKQYIHEEMNMNRADKRVYLNELHLKYNAFLERHERLWLSRNKDGGLEASMEALLKVKDDIEKEMALLDESVFIRTWERLKERTVAAAAAILL